MGLGPDFERRSRRRECLWMARVRPPTAGHGLDLKAFSGTGIRTVQFVACLALIILQQSKEKSRKRTQRIGLAQKSVMVESCAFPARRDIPREFAPATAAAGARTHLGARCSTVRFPRALGRVRRSQRRGIPNDARGSHSSGSRTISPETPVLVASLPIASWDRSDRD